MNQLEAPLWEALLNYRKKGVISFHTPGHKTRSAVFSDISRQVGGDIFSLDSGDEVEEVRFDHSFEGALKAAEKLAGSLFGAEQTFFLLNGTTQGIHGMLLPLQGKLVIPRFSHQAVYEGIMLSRAQPEYIRARFDDEWGIPLPPTLSDVAEFFPPSTRNKNIMLTYPTYYGSTTELSSIVDLVHNLGGSVLVDEAHGGHFQFSPRLPRGALAQGADAAVQSTHKTLGSLTQTSMLHCGSEKWSEILAPTVNLLQTTSPSLILLGVLDAVRRKLALKGSKLVGHAIELAEYLVDQLDGISGVRVRRASKSDDPTKVLFNLTELGLGGTDVERLLRKDYNIQVELSDHRNVLALISIGDTEESVDHLIYAIRHIAEQNHKQVALQNDTVPKYPDIPNAEMSLRDAMYSAREYELLQRSAGRISAGFITPYPPGVPVVVPGEVISSEIIDYITECQRVGWSVRGLEGEKVALIKDMTNFCRNCQ